MVQSSSFSCANQICEDVDAVTPILVRFMGTLFSSKTIRSFCVTKEWFCHREAFFILKCNGNLFSKNVSVQPLN